MSVHSLRIQWLALSVLFCGQAVFSQTGVFYNQAGNHKLHPDAGRTMTGAGVAEQAKLAAGRQGVPVTKLPQFTMVQPNASTSGPTLSGSFAQIASAGGWDTTLTLVNFGAAQSNAGLKFYSNHGSAWPLSFTLPQEPAAGATLASTLDETLAVNTSLLLDTTGPLTAVSEAGSAQLFGGGGIDGFAIFKYTPSNQQAVVPLETRNAPSYLLPFDNTGNIQTGLAIASLGSTAASVHVVVRDDNGAQIPTANGSIQLDQNGHNSFMLTDATYGFPEVAGKRGTVEFDTPAGGRIAVLGLRVNAGAITTLPALADVAAGGGTFAQVAAGGGWQSTITVVNAGTSSARVTLNFFDEKGEPLSLPLSFPQTGGTVSEATVTQAVPAGASLIVATASPASAEAVIGSAQLVTSGNVSGFAVFRYVPSGQEAAVPLETRTPAAYVLAFDNTGGLVTGVAIANPTIKPVSVPVIVRDDSGVPLTTTSIDLAANGHKQFMLTDDPGGYPQTAGKRGTVEFDAPSGGRIAALGIRAQGQVITSVPALARVSTDVAAVAQRELAQAGLSIGLGFNVLQSQEAIIISSGNGFPCNAFNGGGSVQAGDTQFKATVYYDSNCTRPYIVGNITSLTQLTSDSGTITETATYYGPDGKTLGTLALNMMIVDEMSGGQLTGVKLNGLSVFTPATGSQTPVQLGLYCEVQGLGGVFTNSPCSGAVAQDFPALGIAVGSVIPITMNGTTTSGGTFAGGGSTVNGPMGSLVLTNPTPASFVIQGGTPFGTIATSGSAAAFSLFPPTPTGWSVTDTGHDLKFEISVVDNVARTLSLTIKQVSTGKTLATGTTDQSGTGRITYSDGSSAAITSWTLEN